MPDAVFEELQKKYPLVFQKYPMCGFNLPKGWITLVDCLAYRLNEKIGTEAAPELFCCDQVKEKFGGLRFYMSAETSIMTALISLAEDISFHTCEECGDAGVLRAGGWLRTLCDKHSEGREKYKREW